MRTNPIATRAAIGLCGALLLAPAVATACAPAGTPGGVTARVSVQPRTAHPGQTVSILGSCAKRPRATLKSLTSDAGDVTITDRDPQHIRGTLHVACGPGDHRVVLVCNKSQAGTLLPVTSAPAATTTSQRVQHRSPAGYFTMPYAVRGRPCGW